MSDTTICHPTDPHDYDGIESGWDCVCHFCGDVFRPDTPALVCGHCDYFNGLDDWEDDR